MVVEFAGELRLTQSILPQTLGKSRFLRQYYANFLASIMRSGRRRRAPRKFGAGCALEVWRNSAWEVWRRAPWKFEPCGRSLEVWRGAPGRFGAERALEVWRRAPRKFEPCGRSLEVWRGAPGRFGAGRRGCGRRHSKSRSAGMTKSKNLSASTRGESRPS